MKLQCLVCEEQEKVQNLTERTDRYKKILDIYIEMQEYGDKLQETVASAVVTEVKNNIYIAFLSNKHLL